MSQQGQRRYSTVVDWQEGSVVCCEILKNGGFESDESADLESSESATRINYCTSSTFLRTPLRQGLTFQLYHYYLKFTFILFFSHRILGNVWNIL